MLALRAAIKIIPRRYCTWTISLCQGEIGGVCDWPIADGKRIYQSVWPPRALFFSIASAAESFRSTCGSVRGLPECSKQGSPAPTPQVGQGTDDNCSGVKSLIFIRIG